MNHQKQPTNSYGSLFSDGVYLCGIVHASGLKTKGHYFLYKITDNSYPKYMILTAQLAVIPNVPSLVIAHPPMA